MCLPDLMEELKGKEFMEKNTRQMHNFTSTFIMHIFLVNDLAFMLRNEIYRKILKSVRKESVYDNCHRGANKGRIFGGAHFNFIKLRAL